MTIQTDIAKTIADATAAKAAAQVVVDNLGTMIAALTVTAALVADVPPAAPTA
jgi:hypothetical protein